ncbi:MAG: AMP-binding protein [Clostridiales bacterium]|nr:AMP-binding protein [Clostridiales bacterium]
MKLSFSTKGWHNVSWDEFVFAAQDMGFSGIEIHNIHAAAFTQKRGPADPAAAAAVYRDLWGKKLSIPCINSITDLLSSQTKEEKCEEIKQCLTTAKNLKAPYVRIHAIGQDLTAGEEEKDRMVKQIIDEIMPIAEENNIVLLMETMGFYANTERLRNLLNDYASDYLAVLWDFQYPYRENGESAQDSITNLGAYIKHVHIRDSEIIDGKTEFCLIGEGSLPLDELMNALQSVSYDGFLSLEWDPAWMEELQDMSVIFPHFVNFMNRYDKKEEKKFLYTNKIHTGNYVWQKESLINCTFSDVLDRMAEEFPDQYMFKYTTLDYTRTYAEFRDEVDTFARTLISMGVKAGSKVAIWATNVPAWYITFWAATKIGAILVTVNTAYKIHEAEYLLKQSDTHTLVMIESCQDSNYAQIIDELCPELADTKPGKPLHCRRLPFLRNVITVGYRQRGCLTWEEAMARADSVPIEQVKRMAAAVSPHDVCNMQYTSGTTGFPKGVMLTHFSVVNNGKCIGDRMDLSTADRMLIHVPMFHCFGMVLAMTACSTHGSTMCPMPYFSAKNSLACINQERITVMHGVPTMYIAMMNHEDYRKTNFSYMRTGIMAGSGCPAELMKRAAQPDEMHMTGILSVYGQTESSPGITQSELDDPLDERCETVGYALPHVECKVIDPDTGEDCPDNVNGEMVARGYNLMKGYYKMPEATAAAIDKDGWLHTGDLACRTPEGNYKITGRLKDMIIRGGENIYPKEIEEFIYTNPKVKDVQVIGVPDKQYGEEICACIVLKDGESMTEQEMKDFVRASMAKHKVPRYVDFVKAFPMNAAGKILKYKMREEATAKYCQ